jgi:beta-glucosidase
VTVTIELIAETVGLEITPDRLAFWNIDMHYVVEPGEFAIMVGPDSQDLQTVMLADR